MLALMIVAFKIWVSVTKTCAAISILFKISKSVTSSVISRITIVSALVRAFNSLTYNRWTGCLGLISQ